jgi:Fe-S-cluster containining protein
MSETETNTEPEERVEYDSPDLCAACPKPGVCCNNFVLANPDFRFLPENWESEADAQLREWDEPFVVRGEAWREECTYGKTYVTPYLGCNFVTEEGRCSIYENRPETCRIFRPGESALCVFHVNHVRMLVQAHESNPSEPIEVYFPIFPSTGQNEVCKKPLETA